MEVSSNNGGGHPDIKITVDGCDKLAAALRKASEIRFHAAAKITAQNIYNRAIAPGGTPVSTEETRPGGAHGELRQSAGLDVHGDNAVMGYNKDYAPHVEFGHRKRGGKGYVPGQHFLQRNVEIERPAFKRLLEDELKKVLK